jgi:hypothetical protein
MFNGFYDGWNGILGHESPWDKMIIIREYLEKYWSKAR